MIAEDVISQIRNVHKKTPANIPQSLDMAPRVCVRRLIKGGPYDEFAKDKEGKRWHEQSFFCEIDEGYRICQQCVLMVWALHEKQCTGYGGVYSVLAGSNIHTSLACSRPQLSLTRNVSSIWRLASGWTDSCRNPGSLEYGKKVLDGQKYSQVYLKIMSSCLAGLAPGPDLTSQSL